MAGTSRPATPIMKKKIILSLLLIGALWISQTNDFAVWFNTKQFYSPIFMSKFDAFTTGTTVEATLEEQYHVRHGFSLVLPYNRESFKDFDNLDGRIEYSFTSNNKILLTENSGIPKSPIVVLKDNTWNIVLFTFDLPFNKNPKNLILKVKLISPITKLAKYRDSINCKVSPTYWPK